MPRMTTDTDLIASALAAVATADDFAEGALASAQTADRLASSNRHGSIEARALEREAREAQRLNLKRAEVVAEIAQAQALESIADSLARLALAQ